MKTRVAGIAARCIFVLCIPVLLLTASIGCAVNCIWLYEYGFEKYDVGTTTGLAEPELVKIAGTLIDYFNSGEEYIDLIVEKDGVMFELFTREELIHMKDVKGLIRLDYGILLGTAIYALGYAAVGIFRRKYRRRLGWSIVTGSGITLALMLALWLGSLSNFDRVFLQFHHVFFSNEYWSAEGYMLQLFPEGFWYDATLICTLGMAVAAAVVGGLAGAYLFATGKGLHFRQQVS